MTPGTCGFGCDLTISGASRVTELSLDQAGYSGSLSSVSWNLPYINTLDLSTSTFMGKFLSPFSNLTQLSRLALSRNCLSGEIPTSIGSLTDLEELYLDNNNLQGRIPASFCGLRGLKKLEIQSNKLSGDSPDMGSLKNLYFLDASGNAISSELPSALPAPLVEISVRNTRLQGTIRSKTIKDLVFLQVMDLSHDNLSGSAPSFLFTHPSLQQLTLSYNYFTFVKFPATPISTVQSEMIAVDLSNNQIQEFLPYFMASMPKLSASTLENKRFTGMIPDPIRHQGGRTRIRSRPVCRAFAGRELRVGAHTGSTNGAEIG